MNETATRSEKETGSFHSKIQQHAAFPLVFSRTVGLFMPASTAVERSRTAVLFASPWGLEEMCTRKFWRILAEELSGKGIASLRFDYPGTGDALDPPDLQAGLDLWRESLVAAANILRSAGHERLIIISQGLGCALALDMSHRFDNLDGMVLLAPVLSGRMHLRELAVWAKVVDENLQLKEEYRAGQDVSIAGLKLPEKIAKDVRALNPAQRSDLFAGRYLLFDRPDQLGRTEFAAHLRDLGSQVEGRVFAGYEEFVASPLTSQIPYDLVSDIVAWADSIKAPPSFKPMLAHIGLGNAGSLQGEGFVETPTRFGEGERLYGILCEPMVARIGATAIMLNSAYDRHAGWGRLTVETARRLARSGVASLRFDTANVADSPPLAGGPAQVLYSYSQHADVAAALDYVESRQLLPAIAVGRCSGAYLAFQSSLKDNRLRGLVAVNPFAFYWDESRPLQQDLRSTPQTLATYRRKILKAETFRRIANGSIDVRRAALNISQAFLRRVRYAVGASLGITLGSSAEQKSVYAAFETLSDNGVEVSLIYSASDVGLEHLKLHFGAEGAKLERFHNLKLQIIENADHNLTPEFARLLFQEQIMKIAAKVCDVFPWNHF